MSLVFSIFIVQSNDSIYHLYIYILLHNIKTETFFQILDFQVKKFHDFWMETKITDLLQICFLMLTATTSFTELTFLEEPSDLVVSRGNAATLHCSVQSEAGMPNVVWMKDGKPLGLDDQKYVPSFFVSVPDF